MEQADFLQAVQHGAAVLNGGLQLFHRNFPDHGMQRNIAVTSRLNKAHLDQVIDLVQISKFQPVSKSPGRYALGRNEDQAAHNFLFAFGQTVQGEQGMNMVIVGSLFVSAVLGAADLIVGIHSCLFLLQLFQQNLGFQHTVVQQPCCQLHRIGMPMEQTNHFLQKAGLSSCVIKLAHQNKQHVNGKLLDFQSNLVFISATGGEYNSATVFQHHIQELILIPGHIEVVHDQQSVFP